MVLNFSEVGVLRPSSCWTASVAGRGGCAEGASHIEGAGLIAERLALPGEPAVLALVLPRVVLADESDMLRGGCEGLVVELPGGGLLWHGWDHLRGVVWLVVVLGEAEV